MSAVWLDGLRWEVRVRGAGAPVLLLHGFTGRGSGWADHATALARSFRVIVVDLPGHGRSGIPTGPGRASVERTAGDLAAILQRTGSAPAHVVGYSLGARIALRLAIDAPDTIRRLVVESPSAGIASEIDRAARRAADEKLAVRLEAEGIVPFVDAWQRQPVFASHARSSAARRRRLRSERLRNRPAGLAASLRDAGQGSMEPLHRRLGEISAPTLVIAGALDPTGLDRARIVAGTIEGARLEVVAEAGHTPHLETPEIFRSLTLAFLKEESAA